MYSRAAQNKIVIQRQHLMAIFWVCVHLLFSVFSQTALTTLLWLLHSFDSSTEGILEPPWRRLQKRNQQTTLAQRQNRAPARRLLVGRVQRMNYLHPLIGPVVSHVRCRIGRSRGSGSLPNKRMCLLLFLVLWCVPRGHTLHAWPPGYILLN